MNKKSIKPQGPKGTPKGKRVGTIEGGVSTRKKGERITKVTGVDNVVLISDGAEDEYILPIIQSRIKITSVSRVSVKQSHELEDTYYRILKIPISFIIMIFYSIYFY